VSFHEHAVWHVTSHPGKRSLLQSAEWEMSTSQNVAKMLYVWERNPWSRVALASIADYVVYPCTGSLA